MRAKSSRQTTQQTDQRWISLNIVQAAMVPLGLRDRDIAVLRGLLSFVQADKWEGPLVVFASNNALKERCDGIDERTLRRRLGRLCEVGLIERRQSPNRKRYVVRSGDTDTILAYGFDLAPLRSMLPHLEALANQHACEEIDKVALKALIRDRLYRLAEAGFRPETAGEETSDFRKMLRRNCSKQDLQAALDQVDALVLRHVLVVDASGAVILTGSDSHSDRDIHSSNKEYYEKNESVGAQKNEAEVIELQECIERVPTAVSFSQDRPKSWHDITRLAHALAPAIGIKQNLLHGAEAVMGRKGASLAVLGLVQAYPTIKHPVGYLKRLIYKAEKSTLNVYRMFRSLTSERRFPAGNQCIQHL